MASLHSLHRLNAEQISFKKKKTASIYFAKDLLTRHPAASEISSRQRGQGQGSQEPYFLTLGFPLHSSHTTQAHTSEHMCAAAIRRRSNATIHHPGPGWKKSVRARACVHAHVSRSHTHVHLEGLCRWPDNGAKAQSLQTCRKRQGSKERHSFGCLPLVLAACVGPVNQLTV